MCRQDLHNVMTDQNAIWSLAKQCSSSNELGRGRRCEPQTDLTLTGGNMAVFVQM